jgi:uncharacterized protein with FMN-binding domain
VRIRAVLGSLLGSVTVLVIGWQAGAAAAHNAAAETTNSASTSTSADSTSSSGSTSPSASTPSSTSSPSANASSTSSSKGVTGTYTGSTAQTPFGPVQVEIVVSNGKITDVKALQLTNQGGRSVEISNYAAPILRQEVLSAQSAKVSSVGGATYTSHGYVNSLQSALDKANL